MTEREARDLNPEELDTMTGEQLPDREVMAVVSPIPDGDLVFIVPDPEGQPPQPPPTDKAEPPHIDW